MKNDRVACDDTHLRIMSTVMTRDIGVMMTMSNTYLSHDTYTITTIIILFLMQATDDENLFCP